MSTLVDTAIEATFRNGYIVVKMESGVEIKFPINKNRHLVKGTNMQLSNIEISPYGLHWPDLDEDLSLKGLIAGDYGQYAGGRRSRCHEGPIACR